MNAVPLWVTLIGFAVPLFTLAGSSVAYVIKLYQDSADKRRERFFQLMQYIDSPQPIAAKVAAIYQLRTFPEHRDFIIRFCETQRTNVSGPASHLLVDEFDLTRAAVSEI